MTEYRRKLMAIRKEQRAIIDTMAQFAKRSKFITLYYKNTVFELLHIQMNVSGDSKVVDEMIDYCKSKCSFIEDDGDGVVWFRNYDDCAIEEDEEKIELHLEFCVHFKK